MDLKVIVRSIPLLTGLLLFAPDCFANWTLNLGYQNPRPATYGVNFLYVGSQWGFEAGIGWIDVDAEADTDDDDDDEGAGKKEDDDDENDASFAVAGDVDVKYFFSSGGVRPYLQLGLGAGLGADDDSGVHAGAGGPFVGLGIFGGSPSLYVYVAASTSGSRDAPRIEAGIGFDI